MLRFTRRLSGLRDPYNCLVSTRVAKKGTAGTLEGLTFVAKDNFTTTEEPTSCGSRMLKDYVSPFPATSIELLEKAGLVLIGKSNMDEFGMGSSTTNSVHGPVTNPRYLDNRISGGSSGGSASAVAARLCDFALGTDTGGSVRLPASYCGIVGFKPTYGRISRYGVVPYAQGFDCVGILARDVEMTRRVFDVVDKYDEQDITNMPERLREEAKREVSTKKLIIGVPREFLLAELSKESRDQFQLVLEKMLEHGHEIRPVSIPAIGKLLSAYYTLATAEASSNLSRYDGIRYGYLEAAETGEDMIIKNRTHGLGPEVQRRIVLGNYTLSSDSGDHYLRATQLRKRLVDELNDVFKSRNVMTKNHSSEGCDILMAPTAFGKPPTIDQYEEQAHENFLNGYINDVLTVPASMAGIPAISVPCSDADYGVQLMAQYGDDSLLLDFAEYVSKLASA